MLPNERKDRFTLGDAINAKLEAARLQRAHERLLFHASRLPSEELKIVRPALKELRSRYLKLARVLKEKSGHECPPLMSFATLRADYRPDSRSEEGEEEENED